VFVYEEIALRLRQFKISNNINILKILKIIFKNNTTTKEMSNIIKIGFIYYIYLTVPGIIHVSPKKLEI
jgi:hypothetical protein